MARKGYGRPSTLVNITTHADDGSSPVGSNEWNENPKTDGIFGLTKSAQAISSNDIDVTDSYIEVTNAGDIYTLSAVTTSLPSANYASDSASSISEGDLIYIVKAAGVGTVNLKHQNGGAGAGKINTLTAGDKALSATVPTILIARTISSALEWVEFGGSSLGGSITNDELADMAANTIKVRNANSSGAPSDIALATTQILIGNGTGFTAAALSGDVAMDNTGAVTVGTLNQSTTGSAATLTTPRAIGGVNFNGSAAINLPGVNTAGNQATSGLAATATLAASSTALATARTIGGVSFDGTANINLPGVNTAGNQATSGNSATATEATNVTAVANNSTNETVYPTFVDGATGTQGLETDTGLNYNPSTGLLSAVGLTLSGDLTVNGTSTTVDTATLAVEDPLIKLASGNNAADSVDVGFYGLYDVGGTDKYAGIVRDASDSGKFIAFKDLQTEPTTTVDKTATGYTKAIIVADIEGNVTGTVTGNASGLSATLAVASGGTGVTAKTGTGNVVLSTSPTLVTPVLGTPAAGSILTNCTGLPLTTGVTGVLASANLDADTQHLSVAQTVTGKKTFGGAGAVGKLAVAGTTSGSTIIDATAAAGSGTVTLPTTGTLATLAGSETLTNKTLTSPTLTTPALGTPSAGILSGCTALPAAQVTAGTMQSGMTLVAPVLGTPASGDLQSCTALPAAQVTAGTMVTGHTIPDATLTFSIKADISTAYVPVLADSGKIVTLSNASATTCIIPLNSSVAFPVGCSLTWIQIGAGQVTISGISGVTVTSSGGTAASPAITAQHNSATAIKTGTNTWTVIGAIE